MAVLLPVDQAIKRLKENEAQRFDVFVNAPNGEKEYFTRGGVPVKTLPELVKWLEQYDGTVGVETRKMMETLEKTFGSITSGNLFSQRAGDFAGWFTRYWQTPLTGTPANRDVRCRTETADKGPVLVNRGSAAAICPRSLCYFSTSPSSYAYARVGAFNISRVADTDTIIVGVSWFDVNGAFISLGTLDTFGADRIRLGPIEVQYHVDRNFGGVPSTELVMPAGACSYTIWAYAPLGNTDDFELAVSHLFITDGRALDAVAQQVSALNSLMAEQMAALGIWTQVPNITDNEGTEYAQVIVDEDGRVGCGLTVSGEFCAGGVRWQSHELEDNFVWSLVDEDNYQAIGVTSSGQVAVGNIYYHAVSDTSLPVDQSVFNIADEDGYVAFKIEKDGSSTLGGVTLSAQEMQDYVFAIVDEEGYVAFGITKDGKVRYAGQSDPAPTPDPELTKLNIQRTDFMQGFTHGQSLSRGSQGRPALSITPSGNNFTFLSGVMGRSMDAGVDYSDFKPLIEENYETPTSGMLDALSRLLLDSGDTSLWQFVGTAPGHGGLRIDQLNRGTIYWDSMMDQVAAGASVAMSKGQTHSVSFMTWTQGESDYSINRSMKEYYDLLLQMKKDFFADVSAITRQTFVPPVISYQVCAHKRMGRSHNDIAMAQWKAAIDDPHIIMAAPIYHLPHNTDNLHLTNDSYLQLGKYYARALYPALVANTKFLPLQPKQILWNGRFIDIQLHVPKGEIRIDTTLVAGAPNCGFDIWTDGVNDNSAIEFVQTAPGNRIRIKMTRDPGEGDLLTYARGRIGDPNSAGPIDGPRGNIRDQAGDDDNYTDSTEATRYMHNWLVMFQHTYK